MPDLRDAESMPDIGPGYEWYRELAGDDEERLDAPGSGAGGI